jgi:hypothetical protein
MCRSSACAGETQHQPIIAAVRTLWERVGHRSGTAGLETAWTAEILRRMIHGTSPSCLYRAVLVEEMRMHSGLSLISGRQPLDTAVMAQKAQALGGDTLWRRNMPSSPCRASPLPRAPLGAVSQT